MLNARELATLILIGAAVILFVCAPKLRHDVGPATVAVLRAFAAPKVWGLFLAMFVWIAGCLALGWVLRVWTFALLKDAVIIIGVLAIPTLFRLANAESGGTIARELFRNAAGITALLAFYINLEPFPLWAELLLQPLVTVFAMLRTFSATKKEWRYAQALTSFLLVLVLAGSLVWTTTALVRDWSNLDGRELLLAFALTIWLPTLLLPFFYGVAFVMAAEVAIKVRLRSYDRPPSAKVALGVLVGLCFRVGLANRLTAIDLEVVRATTFREAVAAMKTFKAKDAREPRDIRTRRHNLDRYAGNEGVDSTGARLDRREFADTKRALDWIATIEVSEFGREGHYWNDRADELLALNHWGLQEPYGVVVEMTPDRQRWRAWRRTESGWVLGRAGATGWTEWYYAGGEPPSSWPGEAESQWSERDDESEDIVAPPDWANRDGTGDLG
jgi:hypothetical protein